MPYSKTLIHFIWATKIRENSLKKKIFIDTLNCTPNHIHLLISLGREQTVAKTAMLIKGESSFWMNKQDDVKIKFAWQDEYIALSVSYSAVNKVRNYIKNQEEHHRRKTFAEEYDTFMAAHH